jgi:hypothetical protein
MEEEWKGIKRRTRRTIKRKRERGKRYKRIRE